MCERSGIEVGGREENWSKNKRRGKQPARCGGKVKYVLGEALLSHTVIVKKPLLFNLAMRWFRIKNMLSAIRRQFLYQSTEKTTS